MMDLIIPDTLKTTVKMDTVCISLAMVIGMLGHFKMEGCTEMVLIPGLVVAYLLVNMFKMRELGMEKLFIKTVRSLQACGRMASFWSKKELQPYVHRQLQQQQRQHRRRQRQR